ncbi:MAG: phage portal protein [Gammaproteobacteria bacterium]|nr:phage portal protein [Gammaproteobacteria bacterium]
MTTRLETLQRQNSEKKLQFDNLKLDMRIKRAETYNAYDAVAGSGNSVGGGNKRRQSTIETKEETGATGILKPYDRLKSLNLCRDAERNFSGAKSIFHQIKINVIGPSPKVQVNTNNEFGIELTKWINKKWMKNCDFRRNRRFAKMAQLAVAAKAREGDLLVVFDDDLIKDSGKLIFYETDLICDISDPPPEFAEAGYTMSDGIVNDEWGREVGYITTNKRGQTSVPLADATVWPRNPDNEDDNLATLIRSDFRLIQGRGVSPFLSAIADILDSYEMRAKELQTAKVAASLCGTIKRTEAIEDYDDERMNPDNDNPDDTEGATNTLPEKQTKPATYERLESLAGGYFDYLDPDDTFTLHDIKRPNVQMKEFLDYVMDSSGSAFGLAHAYTRMKADSSYTAFRGDMVLTWVSFYAEQKDAENEFLDWSVIRAGRWAIRHEIIKAKPTPGWEEELYWTLPTIPFVDEVKERNAHAIGLKNGELTYSDLLGPDWAKKFTQLQTELNDARSKGLPLSVFETKSGGELGEKEKDNTGDSGNDNQE